MCGSPPSIYSFPMLPGDAVCVCVWDRRVCACFLVGIVVIEEVLLLPFVLELYFTRINVWSFSVDVKVDGSVWMTENEVLRKQNKKVHPIVPVCLDGCVKKKGGRGGNGDLDLDLDFFYGLWILYFSVCVCVLIKLDFLIFFLKKSEFLCMDMNMSTGYKSLCVRDIYRRT